MKKVCMWLAVASLVGIAACKNDESIVLEYAELHLSLDTVKVSGKGGVVSLVVFIDGNPHWSVSGGNDWCTLSRTSGDGFGEGEGDTVIITISENLSLEDARTADLVFTAGSAVRSVHVAQKAAASVLLVVTDRPIILRGSDTTIVVQVESNSPNDWTAKSNADWLTITSSPSGNGNGELTLHIAANPELKQRAALVSLTADTVARCVISQAPGGPVPEGKTTWKILWRVCPALDAYVTLRKQGKDSTYHFQNFMTENEIQLVKDKAALFEEFVEARGNRINVEITFDVWKDTIKVIDVIGNLIYGPRDAKIFDFQPNYDSQILSADYSGMTTDWRGITYSNERYSIVPFKHEVGEDDTRWGYNNSLEQARTYHNGLFVHEWLHQLEWWFPSIGYNMPTLHNNGEAKYTGANPEFAGKDAGMEWYGDMLGGCIKSYPGSTNQYVGVYAGWWQFHPLNPSGK